MPNPIQHLVVLMMENRSFDHMFGFLKSNDWPVEGLTGTETNPDMQGVPVRVTPDARYMGDLAPDPGHDFISVNEQIFGNSQGTGSPNMSGFVKAYHGKTNNVVKSRNVMKCFGAGRLPVLATLAQEYAVCDHWHASVPGPTLPNRAFGFGASSLGKVDMNPDYHALKTIFELLTEQNVTSKIYYTDWTLGLANLHILKNSRKYLSFFDDFSRDCKNNKLPAFSFVEPRYNDFSDRGEFFSAADQHPDHGVMEGEKVIQAVYNAVTSNKQTWESTLLVITYDEHGGLYDHVRPPACVSPNDGHPANVPNFNFDRLGVRVPAVLVSPFIPRRTIINTVFDHTSYLATARKLFIKDFNKFFLTERDRQANTFENCLTLNTARTDKVSFQKPKDVPSGVSANAASRAMTRSTRTTPVADEIAMDGSVAALPNPSTNPISDFQAAMIQHAFALDSRLHPQSRSVTLVSSVTTEQDAAVYLAAIRKQIAKHNKTGGSESLLAASSNGNGSNGKKGAKKSSKKAAKKAAKKSAVKGTKKSAPKKATTKKSASKKSAKKSSAKRK
jgi:phospholipase C